VQGSLIYTHECKADSESRTMSEAKSRHAGGGVTADASKKFWVVGAKNKLLQGSRATRP